MSGGERQRLATWLLTRCTSHFRRDSLIGDLLEQYEARGGWWYWRQALGAVRARALEILMNATETDVPAAEYVGDLIMWIALGLFASVQLSLCAGLLISWAPLLRSAFSADSLGATMGAALIGGAIAAREIFRERAERTRDQQPYHHWTLP